ncbi:MAG: hypothetical protein WBN41_07285 [Lysobacterales bacterium]
MHFKKILIMIVALTLLSSMSIAIAQDEEKNDRLARVALITAKDGQAKALEEAIVKYHHFMGKKKGSMRYHWYSIVTGQDTGKYIARSGGHNWADFDAKHDWDEESAAKFASLVQPHIANAVVTYTQTDDELGIWPDSLEGYEYYSVTSWHIKPGHGAAFNEGLKKIDEVLKAGGFPTYYNFIDTVSGGSGNTTTLVSPRKNFADMAPKEPAFMEVMGKAMGEDEAKAFMADWSKTYTSGENMLLRHMAEQSDYGDDK